MKTFFLIALLAASSMQIRSRLGHRYNPKALKTLAQVGTSQTIMVGGNPATWGPQNRPQPHPMVGGDPATWGPQPHPQPQPQPHPIVGGDPATWGPQNRPQPHPMVGGDPATWGPQNQPQPHPIVGGDPATWGPQAQPMVGGDPATWGPQNQRIHPIVGDDPATWGPQPNGGSGQRVVISNTHHHRHHITQEVHHQFESIVGHPIQEIDMGNFGQGIFQIPQGQGETHSHTYTSTEESVNGEGHKTVSQSHDGHADPVHHYAIHHGQVMGGHM